MIAIPNTPRPLPPFYFLLTFWGDEFRDYLCRLTFPSLLAPGNIPALEDKSRARFLIATTHYDWERLLQEPIFQLLKQHITVEFLSNDEEEDNFPLHKYVRMSRGHAMLADRCFRDGAIAININPDSVYPDGCVASAQRFAEAGTDVILCVAVRFEMEGVERELRDREYIKNGRPLTLPMREAVAIGLRNFHSETRASRWGASNFGRLNLAHRRYHFLTCCYWDVQGEDGCCIVTHNWAPFMVNYAVLGGHDTSALDGRALDGDYIFENFPRYTNAIRVIADSDDIFLLGLTPRAEMMPPRDLIWWRNLPVVREWGMGAVLNRTVFDPGVDQYRRRLYRSWVRFHSYDINERWNPLEAEVKRLIDEYATEDLSDPAGKRLRSFLRRVVIRRVFRVSTWKERYYGVQSPIRRGLAFVWHLAVAIRESRGAILVEWITGLSKRFEKGADGPAHIKNAAIVEIDAVMTSNVAQVRRTQGASFLGFMVYPTSTDSSISVHFAVNVFSPVENDVVIAVFRTDQHRPVFAQCRPVAGGAREIIEATFTFPSGTTKPFGLDFRFGSGKRGKFVFNGPKGAQRPKVPTGASAVEIPCTIV